MFRLVHILVMFAVLLSSQLWAQQDMIDAAKDHETHFEFNEALTIYSTLVGRDPFNPEYHLLRGSVLLHMEDPKQAYDDFRFVMDLDPMDIDGLLGMSKFYTYTHNVDSAVYFTNVAMMMAETFDDQKKSLISKGDIFMNDQQFDAAEGAYLKAYEMDQDDYSVLEKITLALHGQGKEEEAFRYLDMITNENDINEKSLTKMAHLMNQIQLYGEANLYLEQALNLNPNNPEAKLHLSYTYMQLGSYKQALKLVNHSLELNPLNNYAYRVRGEILGRMEKHTKACQDLQRASSLGYMLEHGSDINELFEKYCLGDEEE